MNRITRLLIAKLPFSMCASLMRWDSLCPVQKNTVNLDKRIGQANQKQISNLIIICPEPMISIGKLDPLSN